MHQKINVFLFLIFILTGANHNENKHHGVEAPALASSWSLIIIILKRLNKTESRRPVPVSFLETPQLLKGHSITHMEPSNQSVSDIKNGYPHLFISI